MPQQITWDEWQEIVGSQESGASNLEDGYMSYLNESELVELFETSSVTIRIGNESYVLSISITKEPA